MIRLYVIVAALHAYIGWRIVPDLQVGTPGFAAMAAWLTISALLTPLALFARRVRRQPLSDRLAWAGSLALGSFSSLIVLTLLRDVALLAAAVAAKAFSDSPDSLQPLQHWSAVAVPALALLATIVGFVNARRRARVRTVEIPIAGLPTALRGFNIVQISDLHIGPTIKRPYVDAIVDAVNALDADMIAVTGDLVDGSVERLAHHAAPLGRLAARHGAFFVTGNHEYYSGAASWVVELRRLGLRVLMNEHAVLRHGGAIVVVAGVTDFNAHQFDPRQRSDPRAAAAGSPQEAGVKLLLAHQPRSAFGAASAGFDLQLSGHTHGGQFWPWNHFVRFQQPFTAGLRRVENMWVYTSRGTGYWGPPKRLCAPSEITRLLLVPASERLDSAAAASRTQGGNRSATASSKPPASSATGGTAIPNGYFLNCCAARSAAALNSSAALSTPPLSCCQAASLAFFIS